MNIYRWIQELFYCMLTKCNFIIKCTKHFCSQLELAIRVNLEFSESIRGQTLKIVMWHATSIRSASFQDSRTMLWYNSFITLGPGAISQSIQGHELLQNKLHYWSQLRREWTRPLLQAFIDLEGVNYTQFHSIQIKNKINILVNKRFQSITGE